MCCIFSVAVGACTDANATLSQLITPSVPMLQADASGDGKVDGVDYSIWLSHYQQYKTGKISGDFNYYGVVDGVDYAIWVNEYGS